MHYPKCIALSGAPCTGKTTALKGLAAEFGDRILVVPEIASFVFAAQLYPPATELANHNFVVAISQLRMALEDMALLQRSRLKNLEAIIVDRAVHDAAAYLDGGIDELAAIVGASTKALHDRYEHVLFFTLPPPHILLAHWPSNDNRIDPIDIAKKLDERTLATWKNHPSVAIMPPTDVWEDRYAVVSKTIHDIIR